MPKNASSPAPKVAEVASASEVSRVTQLYNNEAGNVEADPASLLKHAPVWLRKKLAPTPALKVVMFDWDSTLAAREGFIENACVNDYHRMFDAMLQQGIKVGIISHNRTGVVDPRTSEVQTSLKKTGLKKFFDTKLMFGFLQNSRVPNPRGCHNISSVFIDDNGIPDFDNKAAALIRLQRSLGIKPQEMLFVDDSSAHVSKCVHTGACHAYHVHTPGRFDGIPRCMTPGDIANVLAMTKLSHQETDHLAETHMIRFQDSSGISGSTPDHLALSQGGGGGSLASPSTSSSVSSSKVAVPGALLSESSSSKGLSADIDTPYKKEQQLQEFEIAV